MENNEYKKTASSDRSCASVAQPTNAIKLAQEVGANQSRSSVQGENYNGGARKRGWTRVSTNSDSDNKETQCKYVVPNVQRDEEIANSLTEEKENLEEESEMKLENWKDARGILTIDVYNVADIKMIVASKASLFFDLGGLENYVNLEGHNYYRAERKDQENKLEMKSDLAFLLGRVSSRIIGISITDAAIPKISPYLDMTNLETIQIEGEYFSITYKEDGINKIIITLITKNCQTLRNLFLKNMEFFADDEISCLLPRLELFSFIKSKGNRFLDSVVRQAPQTLQKLLYQAPPSPSSWQEL